MKIQLPCKRLFYKSKFVKAKKMKEMMQSIQSLVEGRVKDQ